jgi:hypothetical protein
MKRQIFTFVHDHKLFSALVLELCMYVIKHHVVKSDGAVAPHILNFGTKRR